MKNYLYAAAQICVLLFIGVSCSNQDELFIGEDAIYMNEQTDTTRVSFTYINGDQLRYTQEIHVNTIGKVYDYDRAVNLRISSDNAVEGIDYEPLDKNFFIKAGETELVIPLVLIRTEALQDEMKSVEFELLPNEHFTTHYRWGSHANTNWINSNRLVHTVKYSEFMTQAPPQWNPYLFGPFSPLKFRTICDVMNLEREKFLDATYMAYRSGYIAKYMKKYLADEKAAGRTVYEEDGVTEMQMGPQAQ